jgi:hypothetical protein
MMSNKDRQIPDLEVVIMLGDERIGAAKVNGDYFLAAKY